MHSPMKQVYHCHWLWTNLLGTLALTNPSQLMSSDSPAYCESPTNSDAEEEVGAAYNPPTSREENNCSDELDITAHTSDIIPSTSSPALSLLYPGAKTSAQREHFCCILMKHGLTQAALADILQPLLPAPHTHKHTLIYSHTQG